MRAANKWQREVERASSSAICFATCSLSSAYVRHCTMHSRTACCCCCCCYKAVVGENACVCVCNLSRPGLGTCEARVVPCPTRPHATYCAS